MNSSSIAARCLTLGLVLMAISPPALAEKEPTSPKAIFDRGMVHYNLGEFEAALEDFSRAYEIQPLPDLLFNIGQCHRNLEQYDRAVFFFERYLEEVSSEGERARIRGLLDELRPMVESTRPTQTTHSSTVAEPPPALDTEASAEQAAASPSPSVVQRWWFWALVVGAVGASATAIAVAASGSSPAEPPPGAIVFDFRGL